MKKLSAVIMFLLLSYTMAWGQTFTHERGRFVKDGDNWKEYLPEKSSDVWATYTQYSVDDSFYYISNSSCKLAIPKAIGTYFYIFKNGGWEKIYSQRIEPSNVNPLREKCMLCDGKGFRACNYCNGMGRGPCQMCGGSGYFGFMGRYVGCGSCGGNAYVRGSGVAYCMACRGVGRFKCTSCAGSGWIYKSINISSYGGMNGGWNTGGWSSGGSYSSGSSGGYSSGGSLSSSSGSSSGSSSSRTCLKSSAGDHAHCNGSGVCSRCNGNRKYYDTSYGTPHWVDPCTTCGGSGKCPSCGGTGKR